MIVLLVLLTQLLFCAEMEAADVYLLYSANINGAIQNCNCGINPLGGIDRISTFQEQFRKKNQSVLTINGGDYFNSYPYPALNHAMLEGLDHLKFDIFVPGDQEFIESQTFYDDLFRAGRPGLLLSNSRNLGASQLSFAFGDITIRFYAYLGPESFSFISKPDELILSSHLSAINKTENAVVQVLIYHGKKVLLGDLLNKYPEFNLVLVGHDQGRLIEKMGKAMVVSIGRDGEYVAVIKISNSYRVPSFEVEYQAIDTSFTVDKNIASIKSEYGIK